MSFQSWCSMASIATGELPGQLHGREHVRARCRCRSSRPSPSSSAVVDALRLRDPAERADLVDEAVVEEEVRLRPPAGRAVDEPVRVGQQGRDPAVVGRDQVLRRVAEVAVVEPVRVEVRVDPLLAEGGSGDRAQEAGGREGPAECVHGVLSRSYSGGPRGRSSRGPGCRGSRRRVGARASGPAPRRRRRTRRARPRPSWPPACRRRSGRPGRGAARCPPRARCAGRRRS